MESRFVQCRLTFDEGSDTDAAELAVVTRRLRDELSKLPVESVALVQRAASHGPEVGMRAKAMDVVHWGALLVTLVPARQVFSGLFDLLKGWAARGAQRRIVLELNGQKLDVIGLSASEQHRLIEEFLSANRRVVVAHD